MAFTMAKVADRFVLFTQAAACALPIFGASGFPVNAYSPQRPSAAEPQPNRKDNVYHEGHEDHEVLRKFYYKNNPKPSCPS
jgi:hypothetical protein